MKAKLTRNVAHGQSDNNVLYWASVFNLYAFNYASDLVKAFPCWMIQNFHHMLDQGNNKKLFADSVWFCAFLTRIADFVDHDHFDWLGLDKSEVIGDVGSRSFYLRKSSSSNGGSTSLTTEVVPVRENTPPAAPRPVFLLPNFIARKLGKIARRTHKLWRVIICIWWDQCTKN